ncbi:MAG: MGMT family protein [Rhizobiales bacterium]|nr:MGMT family protein [Hyphomicrobiales bacterium]
MAMSAIEKLRKPQEAKIVQPLPPRVAHWAPPGGSMVISTPAEIDDLVRRIPKGKLATVNTLRDAIASAHGTTIACPVTTGIFLNIVAKASAEHEAMGAKRLTPWWRVLKSDGTLNPKMPGGVAEQKKRLQAEGHKVVAKGKASFTVAGFETKLADLGG